MKYLLSLSLIAATLIFLSIFLVNQKVDSNSNDQTALFINKISKKEEFKAQPSIDQLDDQETNSPDQDIEKRYIEEYGYLFKGMIDQDEIFESQKEFIEKNVKNISFMFDFINTAFYTAINLEKKDDAKKLFKLIQTNFPSEVKHRCYQFFLAFPLSAKVDTLESILLKCKKQKDINEIVETYIGRIYSPDSPEKAVWKYQQLKKKISTLSPASSVFSTIDLEKAKIYSNE